MNVLDGRGSMAMDDNGGWGAVQDFKSVPISSLGEEMEEKDGLVARSYG